MNHHKNKLPSLVARCAAALLALHAAAAEAGGAQTEPLTQATQATAQAASGSTDRIIVRYRESSPGLQASKPSATLAARLVQEASNRRGVIARHVRNTGQGAQVWALDRRMSAEEAQALARQIVAADPEVEYAEPDRIMTPMLAPNDPLYLSQWHYYEAAAGINLPGAWDRSTGSGVVVAVVDTGHRPHADLAANLLPGYDFISDAANAKDGNGRDADASDPGDAVGPGVCSLYPDGKSSSWHGTHVAGTIAAVTNNALGVAGVAYGAKILPVRALGRCGGYESDIADSILWASGATVAGAPANPYPARVINLSLGGGGACSNTYGNAIATARSRGAVVVAAAGNSNKDVSGVAPANCPGVVAVAALSRSGGKASFSNYGSLVSLAAPGESILSTLNTGADAPGADNYAYYQGTSMAAPHVAGVAALMLARNPGLASEDVARQLKHSARAFAVACTGCGTGVVDASSAVTAAEGAAAPSVSITPANIYKSRSGAGGVSASATAVIQNGRAPFTYQWTSSNATFTVVNATLSTAAFNTTLEACSGAITTATVTVSDAYGRTATASARVQVSSSAGGGMLCP